jgi:hypothetical protein
MRGVTDSPSGLSHRNFADPYLRAWRDLRHRRLASFLTLLAFLPLVATAGRLLGAYATCAVTATLGCFVIAYVWVTLFACPQCEKYFAFNFFGFGLGPLQRDCLHCGIEVGTPQKTCRHGHLDSAS